MNVEVESILAQIVQMAKLKGVQSSDVIYDEHSNFSLKSFQGELDEYKVSSTKVVGIRTLKDSQVGISYSESMDESSLKEMVEMSIQNATFSDLSNQEITSSEKNIEDSFHTFKDDITPIEDKIKLSLELESKILSKADYVKSAPYNNFSESETRRYLLNSNGSFCFGKNKYFSCFTSALLEKDGKSSMHYHSSVARTFKELDIENVINESFSNADQLLNATVVPNGKYSVVFSNDVLASFFSCFSSMFSGKSAMENINPFRDKIGQKIANINLTIQDIPKYSDGFSYSSFDDEGFARKDLTLIENGIFKNFYHNSATANYFKTSHNANASRSPKSHLGVSGTQKVISIGKHSSSDVLNGKYLYIVMANGLHSGADFSSGNFSFGVSGYLCENGEILHAVNGITLSGNFYTALKEIEAIGNTLGADSSKSFFSPSIRFSNFSVAGS